MTPRARADYNLSGSDPATGAQTRLSPGWLCRRGSGFESVIYWALSPPAPVAKWPIGARKPGPALVNRGWPKPVARKCRRPLEENGSAGDHCEPAAHWRRPSFLKNSDQAVSGSNLARPTLCTLDHVEKSAKSDEVERQNERQSACSGSWSLEFPWSLDVGVWNFAHEAPSPFRR